MTPRRLGRRLRALRTKHKLTRQQVADGAGITYEYVRRLEAGHYDPTVGVITRLAKVFKVKPSALID